MDRDNLLWESSRMMLPEHRERLLAHQRQLGKKEKPILDGQKIEVLNRIVQEAMAERKKVRLLLYAPDREIERIGLIEKWAPIPPRLCLDLGDGGKEWIDWEEILDIEL
ncbi:YolD-like family protein [Thermicanus aegyptius]|uniref:YolD-like family protein n=1 Tax=Thermicanus aegyptius TaxID=94009 RepID=UPI000428AA6B|nr:YolD-like family protein [Thermicanus aegyptius]